MLKDTILKLTAAGITIASAIGLTSMAAASTALPALAGTTATTTASRPAAPHYRAIPANDPIFDWSNHHTGLCLDDSSHGLRALSCNGLDFQDWNTSFGTSSVLQNVHTGLCLDDSSFGLRAITCNNLDFQDWAFGDS